MSCVHFTGIQKGTCAAGVRYDDVTPLPCIRAGAPAVECPHRREQTAEEIAAENAASEAAWAKFERALAAVSAAIGKPHDCSGEIPCPACGAGTIRYVFRKGHGRRSRGSIAFKCSVFGCVNASGH